MGRRLQHSREQDDSVLINGQVEGRRMRGARRREDVLTLRNLVVKPSVQFQVIERAAP